MLYNKEFPIRDNSIFKNSPNVIKNKEFHIKSTNFSKNVGKSVFRNLWLFYQIEIIKIELITIINLTSNSLISCRKLLNGLTLHRTFVYL